MNPQLIEQIYYVAETISVVAVVVSLIYVGIQVRQNTKAVRNNTLQNISESQLNVYGLLAAHGDLSEICFNAASGKADQRGPEQFRFTAWMHAAIRSLENAFYQHREGALDNRNWQALCRQYGPILNAGLNATYWRERNFIYSEDFRKFVDAELLGQEMPEGWRVPGT